ncbi:hypothetical protein HGP14_05980 [Rhizobium sp. P32RR-XVIII]|uniref:hypothetical protein n=1 Tax=Rhizobium sp. P32RR-XVIII TaxID=2726738 RepID=UPI00145786A2|nr:hypothetical protein [Rhizobium sp. P32RR-XVIII]NLS02921.1 hypothetical protein [Rhizobium sp. P32RR-XVIII]
MGILEVAITNFICARRKAERLDALYHADIREVLVRLVVALAVFAAVIAALQMSSTHNVDPQWVADRVASVEAR